MQLSSRPISVAFATGVIALSGVGVAWACNGTGSGHPGSGPTGATGATGATGTTGASTSATRRHSRRHARLHHRHRV
jgi:hypothetical protein